MNKKIPAIIAAVSVVVAAGGIGIGVKASNKERAAREEADALRTQLAELGSAPAPVRRRPEAAPLVAMKDASDISPEDLAELQEQLAARDAELERLRAALEGRRNNDQPRPSFQERMAQMKEEDPERYAEMIERRTQQQEEMRYDQANRLAAFMNMDTSMMSPEELENHTLLIEKLSEVWERTGDFDPENPPDRETMREVFGSMREIGDLMDSERTVMFRQLGTEVGLTGAESADFAAYVEEIYDNTSMRGMFPRGPRGGGR